jgi:large subunit ribosomal protein L19
VAARGGAATPVSGRECGKEKTTMNVIEKIQQEQIRTDLVPFKVGDTVKVHTRIKEGDRERIQVFAGLIINKQGRGLQETFTVRRISYGEGVERVFPLHSPFIQKIEVERPGNVRRAKLYYLRKRVGKTATKVAEG